MTKPIPKCNYCDKTGVDLVITPRKADMKKDFKMCCKCWKAEQKWSKLQGFKLVGWSIALRRQDYVRKEAQRS